MNALVPAVPQPSNVEVFRMSTDAAGLCRDIVLATSKTIGDRKYVAVEGWEAIALAHGCACSSGNVRVTAEGVSANGQVRRMSDGAIIAEAEGFVGIDEAVWFGGEEEGWKWGEKRGEKIKTMVMRPKRHDYAIRAMAQTRAISRAARSAFAHVVVMMNAGLSTTPAEEVPDGGFEDGGAGARNVTPKDEPAADPPPKADARTTKAKPKTQPSAIQSAAKAAIDACATEADLQAWGQKNADAIKAMDDGDRSAVRLAFGLKLEDLKAGAAGRPEPDPFADGEDHGAPPPDAPQQMTKAQSDAWTATALDFIAAAKTEAELRDWNKVNEQQIMIAQEGDYNRVATAWKARAEAIRNAKTRERA